MRRIYSLGVRSAKLPIKEDLKIKKTAKEASCIDFCCICVNLKDIAKILNAEFQQRIYIT